jgi:hypothetical protein
MTYEQDLNEACKVLGYDSYAHYCEVEKTDEDPSSPYYLNGVWKRLFFKMRKVPSFDFRPFVYPLVCGHFGLVFKFVEAWPMRLENLSSNIEHMQWLADDMENPDIELREDETAWRAGACRGMIVRYLKKTNPCYEGFKEYLFRDYDFTVMVGTMIKWARDCQETEPSVLVKRY